MSELQLEIEELAGHPLNVGSPKQLREVLFSELGLPVIRKTKTGASTDENVLGELAGLHPLPAKIIEHRRYAKLKNTYVDSLPLLVNPETGKIHATFHQIVAATGRLSSSDPNLQNIPIRTDEGREIRSAFVASEPGWQFMTADYSQVELRILAHFSGDATLRAAFANDEDIHALVASQVYDVPLSDVTSAQRRSAKAVNFGVIYGQSAFGLSKSLGIEREEAAEFIEQYFARYPGVVRFLAATLATCREAGEVRTILGRRRAIRGVRQETADPQYGQGAALRQLNLAERTAINTVIQGSAADLIKLAMIRVHQQIHDTGLKGRMLLQIHDELVFETPVAELADLQKLVTEAMTAALDLNVPLKVDVKAGVNWAQCEPVEVG